MPRFISTAATLLVMLSFTNCLPVDKYSSHCKVSNTAQSLIRHLLPMSLTLGGNVYRSYTKISNKWLGPADQWAAADFTLSLGPQSLNRSGLQSRAVLLADHRILSSFLILIRNSTTELQRVPNGTAVAQQLTRLELELQSMITVLKRLEQILALGKTNTTASLGSVTNGSHVTAVIPMRNSQINSDQNSTRSSNSALPTIHGVALRVSLILDDLYSSLLEMDADFSKMRKTKCY